MQGCDDPKKEGNHGEKMVENDKQWLVIEPTLEPVQPFCELIEEKEEDEDEQMRETPIILKKKEKEKEEENEKNEKEKERKEEKRKSKSECAREKKKEASSAEGREVPYPLVPSRKGKERHLARFLDIFKKLEITMPFGEVLQQISKFTSQDAWDRYADNILGQKILPERNVKLFYAKFDEFRREVEKRNWHKELTNFSEGSIDVAIVKEFYANLYDPEDKSPKQVRVGGHLIKFVVDALNTFLKTIVVIEEGRACPPTLACLCLPGRGFELNNCWNLDEPSVTFQGTRKSRARGSEAPSTSAPPTSAPSTSSLPPALAAPVLSGPSAQSFPCLCCRACIRASS
ncbi:hypothetical protein GmHk_05G012983 [Glycine max]|nr:hypothetical protein GmHk_05G012983 [Glycine max]